MKDAVHSHPNPVVDQHPQRWLIQSAAGRGAAAMLLPSPRTCGRRTPVVTLAAATSHVLGRRKLGPGPGVVRVEAVSPWRRWTCDCCRLTRERSCSVRRQKTSCPAPHQTGRTRSVFTILVSSSTLQILCCCYIALRCPVISNTNCLRRVKYVE